MEARTHRSLARPAGRVGALALLMIVTIASPALPQATLGGAWRQDVERFANRLVEAGLTPGMGVAVSQDDWVLYAGGFGVADADSRRGVADDTPFYIASSTKALTATAVVLLAERGELDLEAPVVRYVPGLRFEDPLDADSVTLHDLLTMTHGIDDGGPVVLRTAFTGEGTAELLVELLADYGPSEAGRAFDYGNLGYNILGLVLDPSGWEGWKAVVRREVVEPLGMADTSARLSELRRDRIAMPHDVGPEGGFARIRLAKDDANLHAAGGHFASARDLARFVAAHASGGLLDGRRVLPPEAVEASHRVHAEQDRDFGPFHRHGWGYGWDLGTLEGETLVHRFGGFAGYRAHMSFMPRSGIGVVVLVNGGGPASAAADLMATYIYDRLRGRADLEAEYSRRLEDLGGRAAGFLEGVAEHLGERRARLAPLPRPLADYSGVYESPALGRMEWRVVAGGLEVRMGLARSRAEVYDAAENRLRVELRGGGEVVRFRFPDDSGPASAVEYAGYTLARRSSPGFPAAEGGGVR